MDFHQRNELFYLDLDQFRNMVSDVIQDSYDRASAPP